MAVGIFVGCGGSGIKTLMRLNELLAQDSYWRRYIDEQIYYLLIDTDQTMFDDFDGSLRRHLHGASQPYVERLRLAQAMDNLHPTVLDYFVRPFARDEDKVGEQRLYEHWWSSGPRNPFKASDIKPLKYGAGQCAPVAFFLTWYNLANLHATLDKIFREVKRRVKAKLDKETLSYCIISGLAGGTGRGCWELIAFKTRQYFLRKGITPAPVAFLYDSSVFKNIMDGYPEQELPMKVNALTGFSELSCWVKNVYGHDLVNPPLFKYSLPNMEAPGDSSLDVLKVSLDMDDMAAAPVDNAFLVFDDNPVSVLADNDQYHEMVGAALYAGMSKSALESGRINEPEPYLSLAAGTFEVNAAMLNEYFERLSQVHAVQTLLRKNDSEVENGTDGFLLENGLILGITRENRSAFQAKEKGNLLQRACDELLKSFNNELDALASALDSDNVEEAQEIASSLTAENKMAVSDAVTAALAKFEPDPREAAAKIIEDMYDETQSIENICAFLEQVKHRLSETIEAVPSESLMRLKPEDEAGHLVEAYSGREYKIFGRHFNEQEQVEINNRARISILHANYSALIEELEKAYRSWMGEFGRWQRSAEILKERCNMLLAKFKNEIIETSTGFGGGERRVFDAYFTDPESPENAIPGKHDEILFYRRILKPVMERGKETTLLDRPGFGGEVNRLVIETILEKRFNKDDYDEPHQLGIQLEKGITETVHLKPGFIEQNFNIKKVIEDLRVAWHRRINREGRKDKRVELDEQFYNFFGASFKRSGKEWILPKADDLLLDMAANLASTCRPYWKLRGKPKLHRVTIFLPSSDPKYDENRARYEKKIENYLKNEMGAANVKVYLKIDTDMTKDEKESRANPFVLITYSNAGVDDMKDISSLDYYKEDATVSKWLHRSEDPDGASIFTREDKNRGMGYIDPMYVRNDQIRNLRWKPWIDELPPPPDEEKNKALDAMIYALMTPPEGIRMKMGSYGWHLPLIRDLGRETYAFTRQAYDWVKNKADEDPSCPWQEGKKICQSIWQVLDVFMGKGNRAGGLKKKGIEWKDRILAEQKLFWDTVGIRMGCVVGSEMYRELLSDSAKDFGELRKQASADDENVWLMMINRIKERLNQ